MMTIPVTRSIYFNDAADAASPPLPITSKFVHAFEGMYAEYRIHCD